MDCGGGVMGSAINKGAPEDVAAVAAARRLPVCAEAARALWITVLHIALDEAAGRLRTYHEPEKRERALREAEGWIGSRDFHMVCALAGLDGAAVLARFRAGDYRPGSAGVPQATGPRP